MRIEITYSRNVHTSKGRRTAPERVTLPKAEAERIIANGHARAIEERTKRPAGFRPRALVLEVPDE